MQIQRKPLYTLYKSCRLLKQNPMRLRSATGKPVPISPQATSAVEMSTRTTRSRRAANGKGKERAIEHVLPVTAHASSSRDISADVFEDETEMELDDGLSGVDSSVEEAELQVISSRRRTTRQSLKSDKSRKRIKVISDESNVDVLSVDSDSSFNAAGSDEDESDGHLEEEQADPESSEDERERPTAQRGRSRPTPQSRRSEVLSSMIAPQPIENQDVASANTEDVENGDEEPDAAAPQRRRRAPARRRARTQKQKVCLFL
jgi:hypothetical protein